MQFFRKKNVEFKDVEFIIYTCCGTSKKMLNKGGTKRLFLSYPNLKESSNLQHYDFEMLRY